ncbi:MULTISPECIES: IclR family transcriptional regulator [Streptomyces]|uniref:IclR family transcriptional regulator n=1 Tax=Streptomyces ureilyticus TaxID=1775131 RepID=A0ABX0DUG4_9ACTN|nr:MULTISPECIES: IclR family transcriptional regulator [Streptomyces]WSZ19088.1 IclR family transcriptional regulator [Streptomyces canus]WSZ29537.1 IclR family transcriptional regulator [Streptomyces sp. NBC_00882]MCX5425978.1 IclR family transcriptional regulator [Streptomyces sp. NBC_00078]NGO43534.1 IclR family transcriptional regulator [Streptomyces ureilyticus]WSZ63600.1 IclR family transcriptional regulator [Streptomyces canus]
MLIAENPPSILSKAFDVLRAFNSHERVMTLTELSRASGLPKSTVHRLLARLIELGAIEHHRAGYRIGIELFQLGSTTPAGVMRDAAMPHMARLHRWTGHTVQLGVLRQFDVVYLEKVARNSKSSDPDGVGVRLPASCTAVGKAMLAHENLEDLKHFLPSPLPGLTPHTITDVDKLIPELRRIRQGELAREREEARLGLACVAAPIVVRGFAVGALSVAYPSDVELDPKTGTVLRDTTAQLAKELKQGLPEHARWFPRDV